MDVVGLHYEVVKVWLTFNRIYSDPCLLLLILVERVAKSNFLRSLPASLTSGRAWVMWFLLRTKVLCSSLYSISRPSHYFVTTLDASSSGFRGAKMVRWFPGVPSSRNVRLILLSKVVIMYPTVHVKPGGTCLLQYADMPEYIALLQVQRLVLRSLHFLHDTLQQYIILLYNLRLRIRSVGTCVSTAHTYGWTYAHEFLHHLWMALWVDTLCDCNCLEIR